MKPDQINWEAMQVALERIRIECIAGHIRLARSELTYLMDRLHMLEATINREGDEDVPKNG